MLRLCHKKQTRLSNILTSQESSISETNSSKLSEESIMTEFKFFKQSFSTIPETLSNTINSELIEDDKPTRKHFAFGNIIGKGKYGSVRVAK